MGARQKLNQAALNSCVIIGGLAGVLSRSWLVFFIATAVLVSLSLHSGEIRPNPTERTVTSGRRPRSNGSTFRTRPADRS